MVVTKTYFMLTVADMARALTFYRDGIGLEVRYETPYWSELDASGATLALHHGMAAGGDTGLGFEVDDLDAACQAVGAFGGQVVDPPRDRPEERIRLAIVADGDGNRLQLAQRSD